jgi:hypothetical protein
VHMHGNSRITETLMLQVLERNIRWYSIYFLLLNSWMRAPWKVGQTTTAFAGFIIGAVGTSLDCLVASHVAFSFPHLFKFIKIIENSKKLY